MEAILQSVGALLAAGAVLVVVLVAVAAGRVTRVALRRQNVRVVVRDEVPAPHRAGLDAARPLLESLGFQYRCTTAQDRIVVAEGDEPLWLDVYQHADGRSHAQVMRATPPDPQAPCTIFFSSLLDGGRQLVTGNGVRHNLLVLPDRFALHDDYLPTYAEAWQRHQARLAAVGTRVMTDGMTFLQASRHATTRVLPQAERRGDVVRRGDHWFIGWRAALAFVVRWNLGQRRLRKSRTDASAKEWPQPVPAVPQAEGAHAAVDAMQAEIDAFERQLAVQRAMQGSSRRKWFVFGLTAVLFVAVGSLWHSWTFVPILLAVIALHEGGHFLAMKLSGYRNLAVFFLPGLGGLASGEKPDAGPWEKLCVYLAGPLPGLLVAAAGLGAMVAGSFQPPGWFLEFLWACVVINYLNMLPIPPLDGGRVVETFVFARLPLARFVFAALGAAAFVAFGLWSGDTVLLVVGGLVALSIPYQWRVMQVDRAIARAPGDTLDERGAIGRVFEVLRQSKYAKWSFVQRSAVATALLPELQGRRPRAWESVAAMAVYAACLVGPLALGALAYPQWLGVLTGSPASGIPDDVDALADTPRAAVPPPCDWLAEADRLDVVLAPQRLQVLLEAAELAGEEGDEVRRNRYLQAAQLLARERPAGDPERARTWLDLAGGEQEPAQAAAWRRQAVAELAGTTDRAGLRVLASAKEALSWEEGTSAQVRVALLQDVLSHREQAGLELHELAASRSALARTWFAAGNAAEAESLLRRNVESPAPPPATDRSREALHRRTARLLAQVELAWLLIHLDRAAEAGELLAAGVAIVPGKVSVSWEHPLRRAREAQLWVSLQQRDPAAVAAAWAQYEASRSRLPRAPRPVLMHELDRLVVARAVGDAQLGEAVQDAVRQAAQGREAAAWQVQQVCGGAVEDAAWRHRQWQARRDAARAMGLCNAASTAGQP